ncbi:zinc finger protein-like [Mizuhopecten yessoensis]|uniref:Zinc finger and BTB domain-containing protein 48 n=1 Tax=Mizuhopecten yessoensis TaxID=6573 RepID=A0A210PN76_MIZYE|nr:zinc finger protein-like [Mizuhopecten yessoensis]OWF37938.1 Zinc finger and BTB domain-containing protein 48 [Mizuhopecten yessoensis]
MASEGDRKASFGDENQLSSILSELNAQRNVSRFCDVILKVCGDQIFAHSNVLAAASPYFASFLGLGQDLPRAFSQKTPQIIEIHIDGSEGDSGYGDAVHRVVDYMYTSNIQLNYNVLTPVLEIAKIMQMSKILEFCDLFQRGEDGVKSKESQINTKDANIQTSVTYPHRNHHDPISANEKIEQTPKVEVKRKRGRPRKTPLPSKIPKALNQEKEESMEETAEIKEIDKKEHDKLETEEEEFKDDDQPDLLAYDLDKLEDPAETDDDEPESTPDGRPIRRVRGKRPKYFENYVDSPMVCYNVTKTKSGREIYECQDCPYNSEVMYHFRRHRSSHMNASSKYKCDKCDFSSPRLKVLTNHHRNHLHEDNKCSFCDFQADDKQVLKVHLEKHSGQYPYFCQFCETKFKTKTQLNIHLPKHLDSKPFVCTECNAGFKWKHALKNHMITHSQTKDHLCDICGFTTAHKSQLKAHRLIHTGNTYKCEVPGCTFQATKRQNLKYHMLTHTHEKPHQCEICGQSFSLVKNMKRHMLLHTNTRQYKCKLCIFSTTRYDKLKDHMLKQHGEGEMPKKRFRLFDYPKSMVPSETINFEELGEGEVIPNIVHVENTMSTAQCKIDENSSGEQQIFITNPAGEPFPITLTRIEGMEGVNSGCYQTIQLVAHVE